MLLEHRIGERPRDPEVLLGGDRWQEIEPRSPTGRPEPCDQADECPNGEDQTESDHRDRERRERLAAETADEPPAEEDTEAEAGERPEDRDDDRLPPHHRPHLAASAIDGSEKSELAGPLVNRERERVRDPALAVERGAPGVYNVTDDEPAAVRDWLPVFADAIGAPTPRHVPVWLGRLFGGELGVTMMTELRGASNKKAKRELGWELRYPSWREGFRDGLD
jgi:hypothetical protein